MADEPKLTHLSASGEVHMVDVGGKELTDRTATAEALVLMSDQTTETLFGDTLDKGDALAAARLAGIMGAKRTAELIPLCHPISISSVNVEVVKIAGGARIEAMVTTNGRTGVEMEAMTAVSVAALTLYDMVKGVEKGVQVGSVRLIHKAGGRSGEWRRP